MKSIKSATGGGRPVMLSFCTAEVCVVIVGEVVNDSKGRRLSIAEASESWYESKVRGSAEKNRTATEFRSSSYTNDFDH